MRGLLTGLFLTLSPLIAAAETPRVTVTQGAIEGQTRDNGVHIFKAIPFAAPPVGELRWQAPKPPQGWDGVRQSYDSAPACLQASYGWNDKDAQQSAEDCLYLEVASPDLTPQTPLPVMVYIHGGANRAGVGTGQIYSAIPETGVVLVSIQYRLGVFGFLSHPALSAEQGGASGNYALMDQIAALEWVRDNIAAFGGDANNVTLFGHSAGSQDVGLLMASPRARGLFHKAIMQSGMPQFGLPARSLSENEAMGAALADAYSAHPSDSAAALSDLRKADARSLQTAADKLDPPILDKSFIWLQAVVDGKMLPEAPETVFRKGQQAQVPLIIGVSAREFGGENTVIPEWRAMVRAAYGDQAEKALKFYGIKGWFGKKYDPLYGLAGLAISTDVNFRCPAIWVARHHTAPTYLYQLEVHRPDEAGPVRHGSELPFVFDAPRTESVWPPLRDHWVAFARSGQPDITDRKIIWPVYGKKAAYMAFGTRGPQVQHNLRRPVCDWLDRP
ncbi:MAG: carboxylesterase family protein [Asticcacaulis sp.]